MSFDRINPSRARASNSGTLHDFKMSSGRSKGLNQLIQEYLQDGNSTEVEDVVQYLRTKYPEYKRKKMDALRQAVARTLARELNRDPQRKSKLPDSRPESDIDSDAEAPLPPNVANFNTSIRDTYKRASPSPAPDPRRKKKIKLENDSLETQITNGLKSKHSAHCERPTTRFSHLGGIESILQDIRELVERPILHPEIYVHLGVQPPCGVLLHGPSGCGKTLLAHAIAGELGVPFLKLSAPEIVSGVSGESEAKIRTIFSEAVLAAPSIIFIDEIDAITPKRGTASREMERRIVAQLLTCMDEIVLEKTGGKAVMVIGATNRPDSLDQALRRSGRFDREICLGVPSEKGRTKILEALSNNLRLSGDFNFIEIAQKTPGFVGADLQALVKEAANFAINRIFRVLEQKQSETETPMAIEPEASPDSQTQDEKLETRNSTSNVLSSKTNAFSDKELSDLSITMEDFDNALPTVQPSATREGFATIPDITWDQVGSLESVRRELEMSLLAPVQHRDKFESVGLKSTSCGVLLYGPPGCGKTLVAKAMANQAHLNFISVKGPELLNKYVGESEKSVRRTFSRARASAPCIIFFDELDALVPRRDSKDNQATARVVNQMLTEMDGLDARKEIFLIAASNRPDMIDPAILRPGRLDKMIFLPIPTKQDRIQILKTCAKKTPLAQDVNLESIASDPRCSGYSGADLDLLQREAQAECVRRSIENQEPLIVTNEHYEVALSKVIPSITQQDEKRYNHLNKTIIRSRTRTEAQAAGSTNSEPTPETNVQSS